MLAVLFLPLVCALSRTAVDSACAELAYSNKQLRFYFKDDLENFLCWTSACIYTVEINVLTGR